MLGHQWVGSVGDIGLQLLLKLVDFVAQVCNNVFVGTDVLGDHFLVGLNSHLDVFRTIGILQSVDGFFVLGRGG